jgi:hypothetical protein
MKPSFQHRVPDTQPFEDRLDTGMQRLAWCGTGPIVGLQNRDTQPGPPRLNCSCATGWTGANNEKIPHAPAAEVIPCGRDPIVR